MTGVDPLIVFLRSRLSDRRLSLGNLFHNELTNLRVKPRQLGVPALLARAALLVEDLGQLLDRLSLPSCNLGWMQFVLGRQLRNRLVALDRLKRDLRFELSSVTVSASSWWITLFIADSTLTACLRKQDHL